MAEQALVEEIQKVLEVLRVERGDFALAMLSTEEPTGSWNFIVSAPWGDELTLGEAVRVITQAMAERLSKKSMTLVSRVTVLKTSDPVVRGITAVFSAAAGSSSRVVNCNFGGVEIPYAWILQAQREVRNTRLRARQAERI